MLARWAGWGSLPRLFDEGDDRWATERARVRELLGEDGWRAARRTTINAHYTDAALVQEIWAAVAALGFTGGRVVEPGCGSGTFLAFAPPSAQLVGVELDPVTAAIARHLYGVRARIHVGAFEEWRQPTESFDVAIGNVPFAKFAPHDPVHNRGRHSLHNYVIARSVALVRPGGLVAVLTSRYSLDARNPAWRREIAEHADLVTAVRLPSGAHHRTAGSDVITDLVVLRRREPGRVPAPAPWLDTVETDTATGVVRVNRLFAQRPELVLGTMGAGRAMYRDDDLVVTADGSRPLADQLRDRLAVEVATAREAHLDHRHREPDGPVPVHDRRAPPEVPVAAGTFVVRDGRVCRAGLDGTVAPVERLGDAGSRHVRALIGLRDSLVAVMDAERTGAPDDALTPLRGDLRGRYERFVARWGPLNQFKWVATGRVDADTGEAVLRRSVPRWGGFRDDPEWARVAALEVFDDEAQTAAMAPVLSRRIINVPRVRLGADTAVEALAVCLDECGEARLARVAELLGVAEDVARAELAGLVFEDPVSHRLEPAPRYLSGNVRTKLDDARAAAERDERFALNVTALEEVVPADLGPGEIRAQLGATWIETGDVEAFVAELLDIEVAATYVEVLGRWALQLRSGSRRNVAASSQWGTTRADAVRLIDDALNQRMTTITDELEDGRRVRNEGETLAAREKQEAIKDRFSTWVWEDPARAERLAGVYNRRFNATVVPVYDGDHLSFPGMAAGFEPHGHQRAAVARIVTEGRSLLAHAVGAGKTSTMVMATMELRRLGAVRKPMIVVPNHMLEQFSREWLQLYPDAKLLLADEDTMSARRRKGFVARCALGDWDAVIIRHSSFERVAMGAEYQVAYINDRLDTLREALAAPRADGDRGRTVKQLELAIAKQEARKKDLLAAHRKDSGVRFEETGVDYLVVDEAHAFKNAQLTTALDGLSKPGSQRAEDLSLKLWYLRRTHGERVATFATATPLANSIAEMYVMQRYLQPDVLAAAGIASFDAWAATFGSPVTALELAPDGGSYRMSTRWARFTNVPELLTLFHQVADVQTAEQLDLPVPAVAGGHAEIVTVEPSDELTDYVADLVVRSEAIRSRAVTPDEDNMLKVTGDGRRAALDMRLVDPDARPTSGKIGAVAARVADIYHATCTRRYAGTGGDDHPRRGGLQLVFSDLGTPRAEWNVYDELRRQLVDRGVPGEAVRFIHDAGDDKAKARLFGACRDGRVSVLVGSTEKMGFGTNVQARAVALHHVDCPWRPADIEQREGRVLRQGNLNDQVAIVRYVTEGSFDVYLWQTVERKATFIGQVMRGVVGREIDDVGDAALSYAQVKALATGNPLVMEAAGVDAELAKLRRLERAHHDDQRALSRTIDRSRAVETSERRQAGALRLAAGRHHDTTGDRFMITVDGHRYDKRVEAGTNLRYALAQALKRPHGTVQAVGELGGLAITVRTDHLLGPEASLAIDDAGVEARFTTADVAGADPTGLVARLERPLARLAERAVEHDTLAERAGQELARATARLGAPFEHAERLRYLEHRKHEIEEILAPPPEDPPPAEASFVAAVRRLAPSEPPGL